MRSLSWCLVAGSGLASVAGGCTLASKPDWTDQLRASGTCWRVDLADGLSETSTDELHDLFDCVNRQGAIAPLGRVIPALDTSGRSGEALGVDLARLVNALPKLDVDPWNLAGVALALFEDDSHPIQPVLEVLVELVYGLPYQTIAAGAELGAQADLDHGVLAPLLPVLSPVATAVLDHDADAAGLFSAVLEDQVVADITCTAVGLARTDDAAAAAIAHDAITNLGDALTRATDTSNDRWVDASGDSVRDVCDALLVELGDDGATALTYLRPELGAIVSDPLLVANLHQTLQAAVDDGSLQLLPAQLRYLAVVDRQGRSISASEDSSVGEDSALVGLLRLLDSGNTDVSCSVDVIVTTLDINLGNLSVALLSALADQDPQAAADGVGLLGDVLGWGLTSTTLDLVAASGACPNIDAQLVDDLQSIDRLSDPEVGDLLVVLLSLLDDMRSGEDDHLAQVVDVASALYSRGLVAPLEGAIVDLGSSPLARDLSSIVGLSLDPNVLSVSACPSGSRPIDFEGLMGLVRAGLQDRLGGAPVDIIEAPLQAALSQDGFWVALTNLGQLATSSDARLQDAPELLATVVELDPDLGILRDLAPIMADATVSTPTLRMLEASPLLDALAAPSSDGEGAGVLPWGSGMVLDGTLDTVLRTIDLLVTLLRNDDGDGNDGNGG